MTKRQLPQINVSAIAEKTLKCEQGRRPTTVRQIIIGRLVAYGKVAIPLVLLGRLIQHIRRIFTRINVVVAALAAEKIILIGELWTLARWELFQQPL